MSIYATLFNIQIEDEDHGGAFEDAWFEVWGQGVPNHINEENGYAGPAWDEWLPAFVHKPDCKRSEYVYYDKPAEDAGVDWIRQITDPDDPKAKRRVEHSCDCGMRAVFICDDLTKKATERNGQEYVNPVLVLTGAEYDALSFPDLLERIEESVAERRGKPLCLEPWCTQPSIHTTVRRKEITEAWCEEHDTAKLWRGQRKRRRLAGAS